MYREVDAIAKKVSKILDQNNIDPDSKGGRALLCCAVAACCDRRRSIGDLCAWYADFKQTNVWAVHANMAYACRRAMSGHTPGELIKQVVGEVCQNEDGVSVTERG